MPQTDDTPRLITVAIHTKRRALALKETLEREGIAVTLQNVDLQQPRVAAGVRVRIPEADLALALRIIENPEIFPHADTDGAGGERLVLVPVDFSPCSLKACRSAFSIAAQHKAQVLLLHAWLEPSLLQPRMLDDSLDIGTAAPLAEEDASLTRDVATAMKAFARRIKAMIRSGELQAAPFATRIVEGVPEEVIVDTAKELRPMLIVMGTRAAASRERVVLGSVTAEVLDNCRSNVYTVPESYDVRQHPCEMCRAIYFATPDQEDIVALDALYRLLPEAPLHVVIADVGRRRGADTGRLLAYAREHFSGFTFELLADDGIPLAQQVSHLAATAPGLDFLIVPNKKKNVFARLFNPGLAHRILLEADIPMMVLPV